MDFLIPFIFLACVVLAVSFILWSLGSIQAFQERTRKVEAKQVTARNTLNQFMSKLATVDETFEAMDILVSSFWEDINCESIGIFVLEESTEQETVLRGAACTAMFPIFDTRDGKTHSSTIDNTALEEKVFENPRYRTAHFKSETIVSGQRQRPAGRSDPDAQTDDHRHAGRAGERGHPAAPRLDDDGHSADI